MFTKEDILARLHDGDSIDAIAGEISAILNEANDAYIESKKIDAKRAAKIAIAKQFNDLVIEYAELECPEVAEMIAADMDGEDMNAMVDMLDEFFVFFKSMSDLKNSIAAAPAKAPLKATLNVDMDDDEIIANFIKSFAN